MYASWAPLRQPLSRREAWWKDAEILMLRHQLAVALCEQPGAHSRCRDRPSTDTARVTTRKISFKPTSRRSSHASPNQDLAARHRSRDRADGVRKAFAQVARVFGTHKSGLPWTGEAGTRTIRDLRTCR